MLIRYKRIKIVRILVGHMNLYSYIYLQRDFEKVVAKRNLVPVVPRIPLQKSISTPSIAPVRNQNVKEDNLVS